MTDAKSTCVSVTVGIGRMTVSDVRPLLFSGSFCVVVTVDTDSTSFGSRV